MFQECVHCEHFPSFFTSLVFCRRRDVACRLPTLLSRYKVDEKCQTFLKLLSLPKPMRRVARDDRCNRFYLLLLSTISV